jgi:Ni,Fe-hydrogenase III small subunit
MLNNLKILYHQGKQFIPDVTRAVLPGIFRGRPVISPVDADDMAISDLCPVGAIGLKPLSIDLGKCTFCGECARCFPQKIAFTKDYKIAANLREDLIIREGRDVPVEIRPELVRKEIRQLFGGSLKLRQISAGGDNSCEWELNAANNVQFDMSRFGIDFVASPRHADGIVITGPVTQNMAEPLQICYDAVPDPKIVVLAGTDAISGGIFAGSSAIDRSFIEKTRIDLYIPGNPAHPLTIINGLLDLTRKLKKE